MRRIFLSVLMVLLLCTQLFADAKFYRGQNHIGVVPSTESNSVLYVSVEEAGRLLGFSARRSNDELIMSRGNIQLKVAVGSAAGWRGIAIIPLYSAPFEKGGKIWLDAQSTASLFQSVAGMGAANRLRFSRTEDYAVTASSSKEFGDFDETPQTVTAQTQKPEPEPEIDIASLLESMTKDDSPKTKTAQAPVQPQTVQPPAPVAEALAPVAEAPEPVAKAPAPVVKAPEPVAKAPATVAKTPEPAVSAASVQESRTVTASSPKKSSPSKPQPRLESFKPDDSKTDRDENYNGTIQGIRWTTQEGNHKKIRAVIMAEDDSDPQVFMDKGQLHALFASSLENSAGIASPYSENVKAELKRSVDGIELIFTPKEITKAEKLVLNNPRRIVFDFFYPENVNIVGTSPAAADTDIQLPGQVSQTQSQPQKVTAQVPVQQTQSKTDPVITANPQPSERKTPAVMTPPSTITIPTSPEASERLRQSLGITFNTANARNLNSRKTIVIDPGHGGKDPGAMDNGVREKDVNLAVGLELQRALNARGYNALMTRATDVYLKLQERTDIANNVNADLFVSVHVNALPTRKSMTGFEIYIMALPTDKDAMNLAKIENREYVEGKGMDTANVDRRTEMLLRILGDMQQNNKISESTDFAAALYNAGVRNGLPMRRVAQAPFFVLRGAGMPAVLLEIGFVTNANEAQMLTTQPYQQRIANAMAEGIANYIR